MMYGKKNIFYLFIIFVFFATTVLFGYLYFGAKAKNAQLTEESEKLQLTNLKNEVRAEEGLEYTRKLVDGTRTAKQKLVSQYKEVEEAGEYLEGEVRGIAEESQVVEYVGVDANGNSCYRFVGSTAVEGN